MTFNPSESIAAEVFRNINISCQKKFLTQLFLTPTAGSFGSEKKKRGTGSIPSHQEVWAAAF